MNLGAKVYSVLVGLALASALAIELRTDLFWAKFNLPAFAGVTLVSLLVVGALLRVSGSWLSRSSLGYLAALALIWWLPLNPIERFINDVGRLHVGMSAAEVEAVMASQVKGANLPDRDGKSIILAQPLAGKTYFEPKWQHHSFDTCCLVSWQAERVSDIEVYID